MDFVFRGAHMYIPPCKTFLGSQYIFYSHSIYDIIHTVLSTSQIRGMGKPRILHKNAIF